jgi:hypothetical protein
MMHRLVQLVALAVIAGCATERVYPGPARPSAEIALIVGDPSINAGLPLVAVIRKVDEHKVSFVYSRVTVTPGNHALLIDCVMSAAHTTTRFVIDADVAAGRRYLLVADSAPGNQRCGAVRLEER